MASRKSIPQQMFHHWSSSWINFFGWSFSQIVTREKYGSLPPPPPTATATNSPSKGCFPNSMHAPREKNHARPTNLTWFLLLESGKSGCCDMNSKAKVEHSPTFFPPHRFYASVFCSSLLLLNQTLVFIMDSLLHGATEDRYFANIFPKYV